MELENIEFGSPVDFFCVYVKRAFVSKQKYGLDIILKDRVGTLWKMQEEMS